MIHYQLRCESQPDQPHSFDGWFKDSAAFEKLAKAGLVECTVCGGTRVARALMAPAVAKAPGVKGRPEAAAPRPPASSSAEGASAVPAAAKPLMPRPAAPSSAPGVPGGVAAAGPMPAQLIALLQRMRAEVEKNCEYVGPNFAEEARRLHREAQEGAGPDSSRRGIYGEASEAEAEALRDEGIEIARIPWVPRADG